MNKLIKSALSISAAAAIIFGTLAPATAAPTVSVPTASQASAFQALVPAAAKKVKPKYVTVQKPAVITGKITATKVSNKKKVTLTVGEVVALGKKSGTSYTVSHWKYGQLKVPGKYLKAVTYSPGETVRNTTETLITKAKSTNYPLRKGGDTFFYNFSHKGKTLTWSSTAHDFGTSWTPTKDLKPVKQNVYQLTRDVVAYQRRGYPIKNTFLKKGSKFTSFTVAGDGSNGWDVYKGKFVEFVQINVGLDTYYLPMHPSEVKRIGSRLGKTK
jgi:hypothetical protein